jgi:hypothetical protein
MIRTTKRGHSFVDNMSETRAERQSSYIMRLKKEISPIFWLMNQIKYSSNSVNNNQAHSLEIQ